MLLPTKLGIGSALGSGEQYFPWIHISDAICAIAKCTVDDNISGAYNLVSPSHDDYNIFAKTLAKTLKRPFLIPNVPSIVLKLIFGEMANIILEGSRISPNKIISTGYEFQYQNLNDTLSNLLHR